MIHLIFRSLITLFLILSFPVSSNASDQASGFTIQAGSADFEDNLDVAGQFQDNPGGESDAYSDPFSTPLFDEANNKKIETEKKAEEDEDDEWKIKADYRFKNPDGSTVEIKAPPVTIDSPVDAPNENYVPGEEDDGSGELGDGESIL